MSDATNTIEAMSKEELESEVYLGPKSCFQRKKMELIEARLAGIYAEEAEEVAKAKEAEIFEQRFLSRVD